MSKIRIYELAKELGVDNRAVIEKATQMGMSGKLSHSHSLSEDEAQNLRRAFLRDAMGMTGVAQEDKTLSGVNPVEKTLETSVDQSTGLTSKLVERRQGNVIRRRRTVADEIVETAPAAPASPVIEEFISASEPEVVPVVEAENVVVETPAPEPIFAQEVVEVAAVDEPIEPVKVEPVVVAPVVTPKPMPVSPANIPSYIPKSQIIEEKKAAGPKILGKIELSVPKVERRRETPSFAPRSAATLDDLKNFRVRTTEVSDDSEAASKGKKRGRVVEFSRGELVDYNIRSKKKAGGRRADESNSTQTTAQVAEVKPGVKKPVKLTKQSVTVGELASLMSLKSAQVISKLMEMGVMASINQMIDQDTATIIADEFGFQVEFAGYDEANKIKIEGIDDLSKYKTRAPVVTIMGHVDHGKTSLLDKIRVTSVAAKEHGGITQHIGAYVVQLKDKRTITFIDTPGHAAFTSMRARGANITDIVILVVAADDGVMPQTLEALNHAKSAKVPVIVALNKMDKPGVNPDRIKSQLAEQGLNPEEWGGDTMYVPISALTGMGIESLLESVLVVAEVKELKANHDCRVKGTIIEVRQEQGRGTVATVLVQAGTLKVGDIYLAGANYGRVRSMLDHNGKQIKEAPPSTPVEITGFSGNPVAGDDFIGMESDAQAKEVASHRLQSLIEKQHLELAGGPISLEQFAKHASGSMAKELNVIVKADVHGSLEAVKKALIDLGGDEVKVKVVHSAVGGISESDVQLALAAKAIIVGFNVRGEPRALAQAETQGVDVRFYRIIYDLIDQVKLALGGMLAPIEKEVNLGRVEVRQIFSTPKIGTIAGCYVLDGTVERGASLRLLRDSRVIFEGKMGTLRRFKDDVKEVQSGYECGMSIDGFNDIKSGDIIEVYKIKQEARTL
jgi:translation initiation factor IF-2